MLLIIIYHRKEWLKNADPPEKLMAVEKIDVSSSHTGISFEYWYN